MPISESLIFTLLEPERTSKFKLLSGKSTLEPSERPNKSCHCSIGLSKKPLLKEYIGKLTFKVKLSDNFRDQNDTYYIAGDLTGGGFWVYSKGTNYLKNV